MRALGYLVDMSVLDRGACVGQVGHQRASLSLPPACAGEGNILWDCITMLDEDTKAHLHELSGVRAIAISHPHFYSRMAAWADEFDARVYAHADDRRWVMQPRARHALDRYGARPFERLRAAEMHLHTEACAAHALRRSCERAPRHCAC